MKKISYYIMLIAILVSQVMVAAPKKKSYKSKKPAKTTKTTKSYKSSSKSSKSSKSVSSRSGKNAKNWEGANRNIHHVAFWGGAGYSGLLNKYDNNKFVGGGGGMIGVGYEYKYDHFILNMGPEFRILSSMDKITFPSSYDVAMMADGYNQTKHYTFSDPLKENHLAGQVMLPILVGGSWDKWYFLAGVKVGYSLLGSYNQQGKLTTSITDDAAFDPNWTDMPNHGAITDAPYKTSGKMNYGLDIAATAEVGLNINGFLSKEWNDANAARKHPWHMRVAAFVDYGVKNLAQPIEGPIAMADENEITTRSLQNSDWANGRLNSLLVGVKFTALLQMNKPQPPKPQKPMMTVQLTDEQTNTAIAEATVDITPLVGKNPRTLHRSTNKRGVVASRMSAGTYHLALSHPDYLSMERDYTHQEWDDTLSLALTPRPEYQFYVRDAKSDSLLASIVTFVNASNDATIASIQTDSITGYGSQRLPLNTTVRIHIESEGHLALTAPVTDISGQQTWRLEPIVKERAIILHNLFFATNKTTILPASEPSLQDLYTLLVENPDIRIRIIGHTDNVGSDQANQRLSEGRAESVRKDLIKRGIKADRIEAEGKGESQPIDTNDTEEGRQNNRRVEFMIL